MAELKFKPVRHDHRAFIAKAAGRKGFIEAYDSLAPDYQLASQLLKARSRAGLTQDAVAERMGTTKSAISRLEAAGKHAPSIATLRRYAEAVGCDLQVRLVPLKAS
jgi:DNA-binding XRE family transcriptional regulator